MRLETIDLSALHCLLTACGERGCVYGLTDPRRGHEVAYVGQTSLIAVARYFQHIQEVDGHWAKPTWMRELRVQGMYPGLVILERCPPTSKVLLAKESAWIAKLQAIGQAWVNRATKADPMRLHSEAKARQLEYEANLQVVAAKQRSMDIAEHRRLSREASKARREERIKAAAVKAGAERRRARNTEMLGLRAFVPAIIE